MTAAANQDDGSGFMDPDLEDVLDTRTENGSSGTGETDSGAAKTSAMSPAAVPQSVATQVFTSIQNVIGSAYNDVLIGDDQTRSLNGGAGNDTLVAGEGSDHLTGGAGRDLFVLQQGFGQTTITDFDPSQDSLSFGEGSIGSAQDLINLAHEDSGNVVITLTNGDVLVLQNTSLSDLQSVAIVDAGSPVGLTDGSLVNLPDLT